MALVQQLHSEEPSEGHASANAVGKTIDSLDSEQRLLFLGILALLIWSRLQQSENDQKAFRNASFVLTLTVPRKRREKLLGDLAEEYGEIRSEYGHRRANVWLWCAVVKELWPTLCIAWPTVKKALGWLMNSGAAAWLYRKIQLFLGGM